MKQNSDFETNRDKLKTIRTEKNKISMVKSHNKINVKEHEYDEEEHYNYYDRTNYYSND